MKKFKYKELSEFIDDIDNVRSIIAGNNLNTVSAKNAFDLILAVNDSKYTKESNGSLNKINELTGKVVRELHSEIQSVEYLSYKLGDGSDRNVPSIIKKYIMGRSLGSKDVDEVVKIIRDTLGSYN